MQWLQKNLAKKMDGKKRTDFLNKNQMAGRLPTRLKALNLVVEFQRARQSAIRPYSHRRAQRRCRISCNGFRQTPEAQLQHLRLKCLQRPRDRREYFPQL